LRVWVPFAAAACALAACSSEAPSGAAPAAPAQTIYTTFYPTTYFAERIAPDTFEVVCPLPDGADPIFWQPSREAIASYQKAGAIILNGAEFEKWAITAALPRSRVIDSAADIPGGFITFQTTTHSHGAGGEHTHEGIDGHTWLDPHAAVAQAEAIAGGLSRLFPDHADDFARGFDDLRRDLQDLDARFRELTPALEGVQLLASHPAYNYLARRYGWEIINFDLDPEAPIAAETWNELSDAVDPEARRRIMLWESEPLADNRRPLGGPGSVHLRVTSVLFSPCETLESARIEAGEDYLTVMHANADRLEAAAAEGAGG